MPPATRDFALLAPERLVDCVDAIVLAGGSAFGLAAADGVMEVLEAEGRGLRKPPTGRCRSWWPWPCTTSGWGTRPCAPMPPRAVTRPRTGPPPRRSARSGPAPVPLCPSGSAPRTQSRRAGIASARRDELVVTALVALNAAGSPPPAAQQILETGSTAGSFEQWGARASSLLQTPRCARWSPNAALSKLDCFWVAQGGHDGLARELVPATAAATATRSWPQATGAGARRGRRRAAAGCRRRRRGGARRRGSVRSPRGSLIWFAAVPVFGRRRRRYDFGSENTRSAS